MALRQETIKLLNLLKNGAFDDVIRDSLNITNLKLLDSLKFLEKEGFIIKRSYYSNGTIKYKAIHSQNDMKNFKDRLHLHQIEHPNSETFKALIISDIHIGNEDQRIKELDVAFNYCKKRKIHVILCCGDIIDGTFSKGKQIIKDPYEQIHYMIKHYPSDPHILTFAVGGDHDLSALQHYYQDMLTAIKNRRHDIIVDEYGSFLTNIKEDQLLLYHHIAGRTMEQNNASIILHGHYHQYNTRINNKNVLNISIPPVAMINTDFPSALELTIDFKGNLFSEVHLRQIKLDKKATVVNEKSIELSENRPIKRYRKTL